MAWVFIIVLLALPVAEIAAFIQVAHWIGLLGAIAGVVLSGVLGLSLLRNQSLSTARRVQDGLNRGEMPVVEVFDGACLAIAGVLLILPGYLSDCLALLLLLPPVRLLLRLWLAQRLLRPMMESGEERAPAHSGPAVIEGEWVVVEHDEGETPSQPPVPPKSLR
jgi:UPF0716 protein FxsA